MLNNFNSGGDSKIYIVLMCLLVVVPNCYTNHTRPHIIFIMADDLGWNDVGFHGSGEIPTPNIDALAYSGLILNNYYVTPICTPSRSALMTGKYPIHNGMQHSVLYGAEARGLPLSEKLLPQYLEDLGYDNHIVGKWHLGCYTKEYTPLYRGFKSHIGFWTGHQDYFDHTAVERPGWGLDMRKNLTVAYEFHGEYSTDIFTQEAIKVINTHNPNNPLFLYIGHAAVHSGNPYNPLPAPDELVKNFSYIGDYERERFAGMLTSLDISVGKITQALKENSMLNRSIIVFTTDNGGPAAGFNLNAASNYPLRGVKNTLWEGGVRGAAFIWNSLKTLSRVAEQRMHIVDWLPTLIEAGGGNISLLSNIDGIPLWKALTENKNSERTEILHNIDDIFGSSALTIERWKVLKGTNYDGVWDGWYGPSGRNYNYNINLVLSSLSNKALQSIGNEISPQHIQLLRQQATLNCTPPIDLTSICKPLQAPCLFNIIEDPCETQNLANKYPSVLQHMLDMLESYNKTAVPPGNLPLDPRGDPKNWNYVWTNFGDYK